MRVSTRSLLIDSAIAVGLGWMCWWGSFVDWEPGGGRGRGEFGPRGGPWLHDQSDVLGWVIGPILVFVVGLAVRRIWPRAAFVAIVAGVGGYLAAGADFGLVFAAPALGVYAMATTLPLRRWVPLTALLVPMIVAGHWREPYVGLLDPGLYASLVFGVALAVVPAMFALLRRSRRENERVAREQDRRRYAYEERMRIARDVHDVVGHSLSVITMQAGVALHVLDRRPDQVAESLEAIRTTSREALAELRMTLEMFRDPEAGGPRAPVPGLARLEELVGALRKAGRTVTVERVPTAGHRAAAGPGRPGRLPHHPGGADQRGPARRERDGHRTGGPASRTRLVVEVADDGPATAEPVAGNGIRGMVERARAVGGTVQVTVRPAGGVLVRAVLPVGGESP